MSAAPSSKPNVLIYRDELLVYSETFIKTQAEALTAYTPHYVGTKANDAIPLAAQRTHVLNKGAVAGKLREMSFKLTHRDPMFVNRLRALSPVLIHSHHGFDAMDALHLKRRLSIPLIAHFHGKDFTLKDEYMRRSVYRHRVFYDNEHKLQAEGTLFIGVSQFSVDRLLERGYDPERVVCHYNSIDTDYFQPDPSVDRSPIVLFVGRLTEKKGIKYLIQAMVSVQTAHPDVQLVIIGDGELRAEAEALAQRLIKNYTFEGAQPAATVRSWMQRSRVFCVPSVIAASGDAETFGVVFAEAQATGLPVVSFATGGIPEVVLHGKTGYLASERNFEELGDYILKIISDGQQWQAFSQAGIKHVRENFEITKQIVKLQALYSRVVGEHPQHKKGSI